jgi:hypothetical protein
LALLDEIKKLEDDNREKMQRISFRHQNGFRNPKYDSNLQEPYMMHYPNE